MILLVDSEGPDQTVRIWLIWVNALRIFQKTRFRMARPVWWTTLENGSYVIKGNVNWLAYSSIPNKTFVNHFLNQRIL